MPKILPTHREDDTWPKAGAGEYECIYSGMPPFGLGEAGTLVPAAGRKESARGRIGRAGV